MSIEFRPYEYQRTAINWILDHPRCGLLLDMGLGKTICTLSAIDELIYERLEIRKVLVIARCGWRRRFGRRRPPSGSRPAV